MPKIKTHKSSTKRIVGLTASGAVRLRRMSAQHRARFKSKRAKKLAGQLQISPATVGRKLKGLS